MSGIPKGLIRGGQGRSASDVLGYACCVCGIIPLWFFRNLFPPPKPRPPKQVSTLSAGGRVPFWELDPPAEADGETGVSK